SGYNIEWVEDPSNTSRRYFRNRIRHDLLPALCGANASLPSELLDLSRRAAAWRADVDRLVRRDFGVRVRAGGLDVPARAFKGMDEAGLRILWPAIAAMAGATLDRRSIARLAEFTQKGTVGARALLAGGWEVVRSRDAWQLRASGLEAPRESVLQQSTG